MRKIVFTYISWITANPLTLKTEYFKLKPLPKDSFWHLGKRQPRNSLLWNYIHRLTKLRLLTVNFCLLSSKRRYVAMTSSYLLFDKASWISSRENPIWSIISERKKVGITFWTTWSSANSWTTVCIDTYYYKILTYSSFIFKIRCRFTIRFKFLVIIS